MSRESMLSKITGWISRAGLCRVDSGSAGWPARCLLLRTSLTVIESGLFWFSNWSSCSTPPFPLLTSRFMAVWINLWNMRVANFLPSLLAFLFSNLEWLGSLCWIVLPSLMRASRFSSFHVLSLLSRQLAFSLAFDPQCGHCKSRTGRTVVAMRAMDSRAEPEA